jgi:hypothetical protein
MPLSTGGNTTPIEGDATSGRGVHDTSSPIGHDINVSSNFSCRAGPDFSKIAVNGLVLRQFLQSRYRTKAAFLAI